MHQRVKGLTSVVVGGRRLTWTEYVPVPLLPGKLGAGGRGGGGRGRGEGKVKGEGRVEGEGGGEGESEGGGEGGGNTVIHAQISQPN